MANELFLNFPFGDIEDIKCGETLREKSRNRMRAAVLISDRDTDTIDVRDLIKDAEELSIAAESVDEGASVQLCGFMDQGSFNILHRHAHAIRCAIDGLLETDLENKTALALSELAYGLEMTLYAKREAEDDAFRAQFADGIDPLSPAALEKTLGLDGLRRLYKVFNDLGNDDGALNQLEWYVEQREGVTFHGKESDPDAFEADRAARDGIDPTKPFGYYDESGNPRADESDDAKEEISDARDGTEPTHGDIVIKALLDMGGRKLVDSFAYVAKNHPEFLERAIKDVLQGRGEPAEEELPA